MTSCSSEVWTEPAGARAALARQSGTESISACASPASEYCVRRTARAAFEREGFKVLTKRDRRAAVDGVAGVGVPQPVGRAAGLMPACFAVAFTM